MARNIVIALTGGPCSGKTTMLSVIRQKVENAGWDVYVVPEAASRLIGQGMKLKEAARKGDVGAIMHYEMLIVQTSLDDLKRMQACAQFEEHNSLIICDRGIPDVRAYFPDAADPSFHYTMILQELGLYESEVSSMYDGVIKLTTAANGAEEFYTTENNPARDETPQMACTLDRKIEDAYLGHSYLRVIGNATDFEGKKQRTLEAVFQLMGIPVPYEIERKYLIEVPSFTGFPVTYRVVQIEQSYLNDSDNGEEVRIRRRTIGNSSTYYLTKKRDAGHGRRIETEEMIGLREYLKLMTLRDPMSGTIRKKRYCFLWKEQYFELDMFLNTNDGTCLLEIELTDPDMAVSLPPFITVKEDVTGHSKFSNRRLALYAT